MARILGCDNAATALASRSNRAKACGFLASCSGKTLMAISHPRRGQTRPKTTAILPPTRRFRIRGFSSQLPSLEDARATLQAISHDLICRSDNLSVIIKHGATRLCSFRPRKSTSVAFPISATLGGLHQRLGIRALMPREAHKPDREKGRIWLR